MSEISEKALRAAYEESGDSALFPYEQWCREARQRGEFAAFQRALYDEMREKVEVLGQPLRSTARGLDFLEGWSAAITAVLVLFEPPKPEPRYKPGDWVVVSAPGAVVTSESPNFAADKACLVVRSSTDGLLEVVDTRGRDGGVRASSVRPATPAEIAAARGEAG